MQNIVIFLSIVYFSLPTFAASPDPLSRAFALALRIKTDIYEHKSAPVRTGSTQLEIRPLSESDYKYIANILEQHRSCFNNRERRFWSSGVGAANAYASAVRTEDMLKETRAYINRQPMGQMGFLTYFNNELSRCEYLLTDLISSQPFRSLVNATAAYKLEKAMQNRVFENRQSENPNSSYQLRKPESNSASAPMPERFSGISGSTGASAGTSNNSIGRK